MVPGRVDRSVVLRNLIAHRETFAAVYSGSADQTPLSPNSA